MIYSYIFNTTKWSLWQTNSFQTRQNWLIQAWNKSSTLLFSQKEKELQLTKILIVSNSDNSCPTRIKSLIVFWFFRIVHIVLTFFSFYRTLNWKYIWNSKSLERFNSLTNTKKLFQNWQKRTNTNFVPYKFSSIFAFMCNAISLATAMFSLLPSLFFSVLLDRLTNFFSVFSFYFCFRCEWPISEFLAWYAVCFRLCFRYTQ